VNGFELDLKAYLDESIFIGALSAGTAAILLGLLLLGVSKGDVVLVQTHTHNASLNPILY
jgi:dTDP-4-amino-4,6-dideoxygalactose transaminase